MPMNTPPHSNIPSHLHVLFEAKARKGLSFDQIAKTISRDEVWVAAAFYGQAKFTAEELKKVSETLGLPAQEALNVLGDHWWPTRGLGPMPPTDPVIYRLYEAS
ncbi:Cyanate hydratase [Sphagnurus paluster]|uniref:Cyanate hydratase n=1 Tax=Sphagnurus paluster TaxID=117069 RepID=A0A9P7FVT8_9AGAR|nr:Cyanate hydratase [Sphagnurus paluster]